VYYKGNSALANGTRLRMAIENGIDVLDYMECIRSILGDFDREKGNMYL